MIDTKRLRLRRPVKDDGPALAAGLANFNVARNTSRIPHPYALADAEDFIALTRNESDGVSLVTIRADTGELIGGIGLSAGELGYWLAEPNWRNGYGYEAAEAVTDFHFKISGSNLLKASYHVGNEASRRILIRLGFEETGEQLTYSKARAREVPTVMMRLAR